MKTTIAAHPVTGAVITEFESANGNTLGRMRVEQVTQSTKGGFLSFNKRSAFIVIGADQLEMAKAVLNAGDEYASAGTIQRTESYAPLFDGQKAKIIPGKDGGDDQPYLLNGKSVYFTDSWNENANAKDILLSKDAVLVEEEVSEEAE
jgi:hypothetical protein